MTDIVNYLEEKLSGEKLNVKPRALLLLKLCQLSPLISEEVGDHYWKKLEPISSYIPRKYKEQYKELKEIFHKPEESEAKGFAQVMISEINNASKEVKKSLEEAFSELEEYETIMTLSLNLRNNRSNAAWAPIFEENGVG